MPKRRARIALSLRNPYSAAPVRHAPTVVALMTGLAVRRLAAGGLDAQGTSEALLALVHGLNPHARTGPSIPAQPGTRA